MRQLADNLALIACSEPLLAQKFRDFQPQVVEFVTQPVPDLRVDGELFYGVDADIACRAQVAQYLASPTQFSLRYKTSPDGFGYHQKSLYELNEKAKALGYPTAPRFSALVVLGSGLGLHLEHLISVRQFSHLIVVEPDDDMLYHCLCHVDLNRLSQHCQDNGGSLMLLQPKTAEQFVEQVRRLNQTLGYGMLAELGVYRHYETPLFNRIFEDIKALRHQWQSTWGFFDDEIVGLRHTLANAAQGRRFFAADKLSTIETPVVIVGNGPSLDEELASLQRNRDRLLIVSCGTALAPLAKQGIVPDIHVEMERSPQLFELTGKWLTPEIKRHTWLFALNTVTPELTGAFDHQVLFAKANDLGTGFLTFVGGRRPAPLYFSNPTVTNLAVSACIAVGFNRLVLIGCDYGYKNAAHHHSAESEYYNPDSPIGDATFSAELSVPGNFGGEVGSERIYNLSRQNVERVLQRHPQVNCWNCSDGAFVEGATPIRFDELLAGELLPFEVPPLSALLPQALTQCADIDEDSLERQFQPARRTMENLIKALKAEPGASELLVLLNNTTVGLDRLNCDGAEYLLFCGVMRYFSVTLYGHISRLPAETLADYSRFFSRVLLTFCDYCLTTMAFLNPKKENNNEV